MPTTNRKMKRDVGQLGEDEFKRWFTLNRLSAVKSSPDQLGWDFFVEFEPEVDDARPLDQQNDLKKVLIQVKATDTMPGSVRGKLSAFKLLVGTDLPAFVARSATPAGEPRVGRGFCISVPSRSRPFSAKCAKRRKRGALICTASEWRCAWTRLLRSNRPGAISGSSSAMLFRTAPGSTSPQRRRSGRHAVTTRTRGMSPSLQARAVKTWLIG